MIEEVPLKGRTVASFAESKTALAADLSFVLLPFQGDAATGAGFYIMTRFGTELCEAIDADTRFESVAPTGFRCQYLGDQNAPDCHRFVGTKEELMANLGVSGIPLELE